MPILRSFVVANFTSLYAFTIIIPTLLIHLFRSNTLIEHKYVRRQYKPYLNPYNLGFITNFKRTFGKPGILCLRWILPLSKVEYNKTYNLEIS